MAEHPSVMFVCVHNAGRSQMAAAYTRRLSGGAVEVRSAGSAPAETINPAVREALLEEGIDISAEKPKIFTSEAVEASDVVGTFAPTSPASAIWIGSWTIPPVRVSRPCARFETRSSAGWLACLVRWAWKLWGTGMSRLSSRPQPTSSVRPVASGHAHASDAVATVQ